jgi:hypothetical protein
MGRPQKSADGCSGTKDVVLLQPFVGVDDGQTDFQQQQKSTRQNHVPRQPNDPATAGTHAYNTKVLLANYFIE